MQQYETKYNHIEQNFPQKFRRTHLCVSTKNITIAIIVMNR
jgi:hypothetical protein